MTDRLTHDEARGNIYSRLAGISLGTLMAGSAARPEFIEEQVDTILATVDALAVLVTWPALLAAGERAGKVRKVPTHLKGSVDWSRVTYRLTDPEAAP